MKNLFQWIRLRGKPLYEYGQCHERRARRNRLTGDVEFVLWKAGEQGHTEDYWHKVGDGLRCVAIVEVFGKNWKLEYMTLPVGRHKLYAQQYTYNAPPLHSKPMSDGWILGMWPDTGFPDKVLAFARAIETAHGITGEK